MKNRDYSCATRRRQTHEQWQARISDGMTPQEWATLRDELCNFVCEGQYADGMLAHPRSIPGPRGRHGPKRRVGERLLWQRQIAPTEDAGPPLVNTVFPDGTTARSLVHSYAGIEAALKELDTAGRRAGGMHAALGALPSGSGESTRLTILGIILARAGCGTIPVAKFCLYLKANGFYDVVKKEVEAKARISCGN